jgi:hypothetical protein
MKTMSKLKPILIIVFLCCLITLEVNAAIEIENPLEDFAAVRTTDLTDNDVLIMQADLNGDLKNEVFLSCEKDTNARAGNIWMVYISKEDKFYRSDNIVSLAPGGIIQKVSIKTGQNRLITFRSPERGILTLWEITVSDANLIENKIARIELLGDYQYTDDFLDLFGDGNISRVPVTQGTLADLRKSFKLDNKAKEIKPAGEPNLPLTKELKSPEKTEELKQFPKPELKIEIPLAKNRPFVWSAFSAGVAFGICAFGLVLLINKKTKRH